MINMLGGPSGSDDELLAAYQDVSNAHDACLKRIADDEKRIEALEAENAKLRRQVEFVKRESLLAIPDRCGRHEETKCLLCKGQWYVECAPRHEKDCPHNHTEAR